MPTSRRAFLTRTATLAAATTLSPLALGRTAAAATPTMAVSVNKVDITPPAGTPMAGYYEFLPTDRLSTGVSAPLYARCTILWDNGFPNVIVTADTLVIPRAVNQDIRARVSALGIAGSDFVLTATHTHSGPVLNGDLNPLIAYGIADSSPQAWAVQDAREAFEDAVVQLVSDTLGAVRTPCTLDYKVGTATFAANREGLTYNERDVPILVARSLAGAPLAVLYGYGCHPVSLGSPANPTFNPDYPGVATATIESSTGAFAQFLLGPAGDQDPSQNLTRGTALCQSLGQSLGQTVANAVATPGRSIAGPILTDYQEVSLPLSIPTASTMTADFTSRLNDVAWDKRHATAMLAQIQAADYATAIPLPLQVWKLSGGTPLRLALTGGELVSDYGEIFRSLYPNRSNDIWIAGYANEVPAYIPSDTLLNSGAPSTTRAAGPRTSRRSAAARWSSTDGSATSRAGRRAPRRTGSSRY
ncbi:hypothetical protein ACFQ9X_35580 [Catenulispora yoronensis]